jgi:NAD+ kinase
MRTGLFGNDYQVENRKYIRTLFDKLQALDTEVFIERQFYNYLTQHSGYKPDIAGLIESEQLALDLAISLGGDGTFLRTAAWVGRQNIPILGINMGRLGFLADVNTEDIDATLNEIFRQEYTVEERSVLELKSDPPFRDIYNYALNEIAVLKRDTSSMITIHTLLNEEYLTNYLGDGLLIATPTGSTAYSMSVNGPIILPQANNFVLSPVAPHSLNVRPLVIPEDYCIRLKVESRNNNFLVALDGRSEIYPSGSEFLIRKADFTIKLVKRYPQNFYETLRKKLLWGADVREHNQFNP